MPPASSLRRLLVQATHYSMAGLLTTLAGFISFPFLTRIFTVADYGVMSLVSTTLMLLVSVGKLGVQHAVIRFHAEVASKKQADALRTFYATSLYGMVGTGAVVALLWALSVRWLPLGWLNDPRLRGLFVLTAVIIPAQVADSALVNFLRAAQLSTQLAKYQVVKKYVGLALIVAGLLVVARDLRVFYGATILTEVAFPIALGLYFFRPGIDRPRPAPQAFSPSLYRDMLRYGVPMMFGYEVSAIILSLGDRYVIQAKIGAAPLGVYAAAYNLCTYVQIVFISSVMQALMPIYMKLWAESGEAETRKFLEQSLRHYVVLALPVAAGLTAVGSELLPAVASEKYLSGAVIIPFVIGGLIVDGAGTILGAGLFIQRQTTVIGALVLGSAAGNIALNMFLVPRQGILGAAIATLASYLGLTGAMAFFGLRRLPLSVPWGALVKAALASAVMYAAVRPLHLDGRLSSSLVKVAGGLVVYAVVIAGLDRESREAFVSIGRRLRGRP